jgi:membrane fusion protein, multidrug efflux system
VSRVLCLLAMAGLAACGAPEQVEPVADRAPEPVDVLVVSPTRFEQWVETTGAIEAQDDAELAAQIGGTVASVADEGRRVSEGEVVAQVDPAQAEAALHGAQAALAEVEARLEEAEEAYRRWLPLVEEQIISQLEFEQVQAQRAQAAASRQQALASVREAEQRLEQTRLRAPFTGTVEQRLVRAGEQVTAGQPLVRLVGTGPRYVTAGLPERYAGEIRVGARAVLRLRAYGIEDVESTVTFVGGAVDPRSRTFPVRVAIEDPDHRTKVEMIAQVRVVRQSRDDALVVPREALLRDDRGDAVLLVDADVDGDGVVRRVPIVTGPASPQGIVVEDGLQPGDEVVVMGHEGLRDGEVVHVVQRHADIEGYRTAVGSAGPT